MFTKENEVVKETMEERVMEERRKTVAQMEVTTQKAEYTRQGILLYTNNWDYKVYVVVTREISSKRVSFDFYTISPDGKLSDIIPIQRGKVLKSQETCLNFFYNMEGDFDRDDIFKIKNELSKLLLNNNKYWVNTQENQTMEEIHQELSNYIRSNEEELEDNPLAEIFIKDEYGYLRTNKMDAFIKESENLSYKRTGVLKRLKIMGILVVGKNRPYDIKVSMGGQKLNYYKIRLTNQIEVDDDIDEIIGEGK